MRRKKAQAGRAEAGGDGRLTPADVQEVEFRLAFRGYNERDVDAFLDRVTEELSMCVEENERLRAGAGLPARSSASGPEATADEVEAILADARAQAAQILREAEATAALAGAGPSAGADARTAVVPFLKRERDFLQGLGGLVQGHAEEVKAMVLALRARTEGTGNRAEPRTVPAPAGAEQVVIEEPDEPGSDEPEPEHEPPVRSVMIHDEPEPEPVPVEQPSGERSLRDLFWGED